jgi:pyruvate/2-oxoglutarate dehydrogenase complex dihydrolipoamide dehydrogenase (E3) component
MAQSFARLGSQVSLIESSAGILPKEDPEAAAIVQARLQQDGVSLLSSAQHLQLAPGPGGTIQITLDSMGLTHNLTVDHLLLAAGRAPNIEGLNLETAGVRYDRTGVLVDDMLRTTNRRIFAAGDICSRYQFTHSADFMARMVIQNALFFGRKKMSQLIIPWATYTSPEIAHVGLTAAQAQARGLKITTYTQPLSGVDRALLDDETDGMVRVHVRQGTDQIVGATIVAEQAGDMISEITLAMTHKIGLGGIAATIHPYPTQADAIRKIGDQYNRTRLTPRLRSLFSTLMSWRRR